jgi:hypothetical protein
VSEAADGIATPPVEILRRWERNGAVWQVISRSETQVEVALMTCTVAEVVERIASDDPELLDFIGDRMSSDE